MNRISSTRVVLSQLKHYTPFPPCPYADRGSGYLVFQRNLIENPHGASNDRDTGHPAGPQGISLINSSGNNVIRYNEIVTTEDHGFNDAIGGGSNFSNEGSPNRDSDIYGNIIAGVWDDGIESEGDNMMCASGATRSTIAPAGSRRVSRSTMRATMITISTAATSAAARRSATACAGSWRMCLPITSNSIPRR